MRYILLALIHQIAIYPSDSVICHLNNWDQDDKNLLPGHSFEFKGYLMQKKCAKWCQCRNREGVVGGIYTKRKVPIFKLVTGPLWFRTYLSQKYFNSSSLKFADVLLGKELTWHQQNHGYICLSQGHNLEGSPSLQIWVALQTKAKYTQSIIFKCL